MDSRPEEYELNGDVLPGSPGSPDASDLIRRPPRWGRNRPINMNHYANKKSAAESMLDIALLLANASQLKAVIEHGPGFAFFIPLVVLISVSLMLQIGVGVLLIFLGSLRWNKWGLLPDFFHEANSTDCLSHLSLLMLPPPGWSFLPQNMNF
ncbi:ninjurin-1 isoform X5 [Balaenoptera musculus]|uniref:Ninjurin-1 isoform X5 n=1 Tax=Balaenoptera musculus TaxID=9771 RepID=A0A8B8XKS7_BALMU|nr:ninjurin-1 isoform X5 [Balaenoptera musculus]